MKYDKGEKTTIEIWERKILRSMQADQKNYDELTWLYDQLTITQGSRNQRKKRLNLEVNYSKKYKRSKS